MLAILSSTGRFWEIGQQERFDSTSSADPRLHELEVRRLRRTVRRFSNRRGLGRGARAGSSTAHREQTGTASAGNRRSVVTARGG